MNKTSRFKARKSQRIPPKGMESKFSNSAGKRKERKEKKREEMNIFIRKAFDLLLRRSLT